MKKVALLFASATALASVVYAQPSYPATMSFGGGGMQVGSGPMIYDTMVFGQEFKALIDGRMEFVRGNSDCRPKVNPPIEYHDTGKDFWRQTRSDCIVVEGTTTTVDVSLDGGRREVWTVVHNADGSFRFKRPDGHFVTAEK
jgi:hypothetical protein